MTKDKLEKRQHMYKIGCVVEFTERLPYWQLTNRNHKNSKAIVIEPKSNVYNWRNMKYWVKVRLVDYPDETAWVRKSDHIRLVSKNTAIMESL